MSDTFENREAVVRELGRSLNVLIEELAKHDGVDLKELATGELLFKSGVESLMRAVKK